MYHDEFFPLSSIRQPTIHVDRSITFKSMLHDRHRRNASAVRIIYIVLASVSLRHDHWVLFHNNIDRGRRRSANWRSLISGASFKRSTHSQPWIDRSSELLLFIRCWTVTETAIRKMLLIRGLRVKLIFSASPFSQPNRSPQDRQPVHPLSQSVSRASENYISKLLIVGVV